LAWGENLEWFNYFMFDVFPLYNKFRTVEMTLVIAAVTIPLLGMLGLKKVMDNPAVIRENSNKFLAAFGLTGGVALLLYLFPEFFFNFMSDQEMTALAQQKQNMPGQAGAIDQVIRSMQQARIGLLKSDAIRSFFFILLGSGSLWLYATNRLSKKYVLPGLVLLIIFDLWSVGGYHGAKLRIYQDVIDHYLQTNWQTLSGHFSNGGTPGRAKDLLSDMAVVNMLNTKYVIYHPGQEPLKNPYRFGQAWFVNNLKEVSSAVQELASLRDTDLRNTAIIRDRQVGEWSGYQNTDSTGNIRLSTYEPEKLVYEAQVSSDKLTVFSEIYYPKGWNAYIDGKEVEIKRVNYILRALMVPVGKHTIEFRFEPNSVKMANTLAVIGGILIILLVLFVIWRYLNKWQKNIQ
jgi:hypothetical protein